MKSEFYPDYLEEATAYYASFMSTFSEAAEKSATSADLLRKIVAQKGPDSTQLLRIFRKYVSPTTPVEMLKRKRKVEEVISNFGPTFRPIEEVRYALASRSAEDETLAALLWEYRERGQKGYKLTEDFFAWFDIELGSKFGIAGPQRAGRDLILSEELEGYEHKTPADFLIRSSSGVPLVVGFARYDSDRGGAQEVDRPGGYSDTAYKLRNYSAGKGVPLKILFLNDGPGLLLGRMWEAYAKLEEDGEGDVMVATLHMLKERLTEEWIAS